MYTPVAIPGFPNCFKTGKLVSVFLSEKGDNLKVPNDYIHLLKTDLFHGNTKTMMISNNKGDLFVNNFTFYVSITTAEIPEIVCFIFFPKVFILPEDGLTYEEYYSLSKNIYQELLTKTSNFALYDSSKLDQAKSLFDFLLSEYYEKLCKLESKLKNITYGKTNHIISSDKIIGEVDNFLWMQNGYNPLNIPQRVPTEYISDILILSYECLNFLKTHRIDQLPESDTKYRVLSKIKFLMHKIKTNHYLRKPIKGNNFNQEIIELKSVFNKSKMKEDIINNPEVFKALKMLFYSELRNNSVFVKTFNLTIIWEDLVSDYLNIPLDKRKKNNKAYYGKFSSEPDGIDAVGKILDYKYKTLEKGIDGDDVTKLWRDVITQNNITDLNTGSFEGELIYASSISLKSGNIPTFSLKVSPTDKIHTKIPNDSNLFDAIKLYYSELNIFTEKK